MHNSFRRHLGFLGLLARIALRVVLAPWRVKNGGMRQGGKGQLVSPASKQRRTVHAARQHAAHVPHTVGEAPRQECRRLEGGRDLYVPVWMYGGQADEINRPQV